MTEKYINGVSELLWKKRYVAYMLKHSNAEVWECEESADIAWDNEEKLSPEECALEELLMFDE